MKGECDCGRPREHQSLLPTARQQLLLVVQTVNFKFPIGAVTIFNCQPVNFKFPIGAIIVRRTNAVLNSLSNSNSQGRSNTSYARNVLVRFDSTSLYYLAGAAS